MSKTQPATETYLATQRLATSRASRRDPPLDEIHLTTSRTRDEIHLSTDEPHLRRVAPLDEIHLATSRTRDEIHLTTDDPHLRRVAPLDEIHLATSRTARRNAPCPSTKARDAHAGRDERSSRRSGDYSSR